MFEAFWALDKNGEQIVKFAWSKPLQALNAWAQIFAKLIHCSKELMRWNASKKRDSRKKFNEKWSLLNQLQNWESSEDIGTIKQLEEEIALWLE